MKIKISNANAPVWKDVTVKSRIPEELKKLEEMANRDGLTGAFNKAFMHKKLDEVFNGNRRQNSIAIMDIDYFKNYNDKNGHMEGDNLLKMLSQLITDSLRDDDMLFRFGGEEFLLTLPDYDDSEALQILEALHEEIKNTVVTSGDVDVRINVCIGLSSYPNLCDNPEKLVSRADKAMYYGKKHGRGRLVIDSPAIDEE